MNMNENVAPVTVTSNGSRLLKLRIVKDPDKGLLIEAQSSVDFRMLRSPNNKKMVFAGVQCFHPFTSELLQGLRSYFFPNDNQENRLFYGDYPNLMILLAEKLKEGVVFQMGLYPVSQETILNWIQLLKEEVKILYHLYIKSFDVEVEFTTKIVEKEIIE